MAAAGAGAAVDDWTQAKAKGNQAYQAGDHQQAIKHFSTAIQLETPKNEGKQLHILYSNRSAAALSLGLAHEALADAKKCTELEQTFAKGWSRVGAALYRLGRYPEAMAAYEAGLQQSPGNAVSLFGVWAREAEKDRVGYNSFFDYYIIVLARARFLTSSSPPLLHTTFTTTHPPHRTSPAPSPKPAKPPMTCASPPSTSSCPKCKSSC